MTTNPLVANVHSSTSWHSALGSVDDVANLCQEAGSHEWVSAGLTATEAVGDTATLISDPIQTLMSWGLHWVIEHVEPFPSLLDHLAGNPDEIDSFAQTWHNVGQRIRQDADQFRSTVAADTSPWSGPAVEAYRAATTVQSAVIDGFGEMCDGIAAAVQLAGSIVTGVRKIVEKIFCDIVSWIGSNLWKFLTGVLIPEALGELAAKVASDSSTVLKFVNNLVESIKKLTEILAKVSHSIADATKGVREVAAKLANGPETLRGDIKEAEKGAVAHTLDTGSFEPGDPPETADSEKPVP